MKLKINGHDLYVEQHGSDSGPEVVLLHHGLGSVRAWREQIPVLVEAGYHVTAYDRWGYGGSEDRVGLDLPTFATDIQDLHRLLEQLEINHAALVGHSDGGTIALYFSAQYPELVTCLVTIAAHIYIELSMEPGMLGIKKTFEMDEHFRRGLLCAHGAKYEQVFHNWFDGWHHSELLSWEMRPVIKQIGCPALIVQGENDEFATPQHAIDIAEAISGAKVWIIPNVGHMLPLENADILNQRLLQFLKEHSIVASEQGY